MTDREPLYYDDVSDKVTRMGTDDKIPSSLLDDEVLLTNAAGVPFTAENGIEATNAQGAIAEVAGRYAGGRRTAYFPYKVRRSWDRIQRVHRVGTWVAGDAGSAALTAVVDTHGTTGHLYPFMTFSAIDSNGNPHRDHDRLSTAGGPTLATNTTNTISTAAHSADKFKFVIVTDVWGTGGLNFEVGDTVYAYGFANANGRWEVDAIESAGKDLVVIDPGNSVSTYDAAASTHEVRGTQGNSSGFNGYAEGLFMLANSLEVEERIRFEASGLMENPASGGGSNAFVEFVLEPNPADSMDSPGTDQYAGANRMRMLTGDLGATWSGVKSFSWWCELAMGSAPTGDEYQYNWGVDIEDVIDTGGSMRVTGGHSFKSLDTFLSPRFRVDLDQATRLDTYDATNQGQGLRLEIQKYDAGMVQR